MKKHPAQLLSIDVKELNLKSLYNDFEDKEVDLGGRGKIHAGNSSYDPEKQQIASGLLFVVDPSQEDAEDQKPPYEIRIDIRGLFKIDEAAFDNNAERIQEWASNNAFYILLPYLREQLYSLTQKAGFRPAILPLAQVPTFVLNTPKTDN